MNESAKRTSFQGHSIVACGTLRREIQALADEKFLDADKVLFTAPGLHEWPRVLEKQLTRQMTKAREASEKVLVVYGEKCYLDFEADIDTDGLLRRLGPEYRRVRATNCVDMLASREERARIASGAKVYWLPPGWLEHWDFIFKDWDRGKANEMFPANDKAVVLDAIGYFDELANTSPERILTISEWMKLPIEACVVSLDRLKRLLSEQVTSS